MISIKSQDEIEKMRLAGKINYQTHQLLKSKVRPGITTKELNDIGEAFILSQGATPSFKGLYGYPAALCISVNNEVVHGIPGNRKLKNGDIVKIDIGVYKNGYHSDSAWSYPVGTISKEKEKLLEYTEEALFAGLSKVKNGVRLGDVSHSIEITAKKHNLGVVRELVGHGVGTKLHEKPDVPNYGQRGVGPVLKTGMTIAVEPMLNLGARDVWQEDDGWTISTQDGYPSAHFEHTIVVTDDGYEILTKE